LSKTSNFFCSGRRFTIEEALCIDGLLAYGIQEGPMDSKDFEFFIENIIIGMIINK
jgi:hypothetical protein